MHTYRRVSSNEVATLEKIVDADVPDLRRAAGRSFVRHTNNNSQNNSNQNNNQKLL